MNDILHNDPMAFQELYLRYKAPLYSYLCINTNKNHAEDLLQDIFIKMLHKKHTFRFESKFKTWIWIIAKNTLIDFTRTASFKAEQISDELINEEGEERFSASLVSAEDALIEKITQQQLNDCLSSLPTKQKEILSHYLYSDLSYEEIAQQSSLSISAVKSLIFRAKEKLIICFKGADHS